MICIIAISKQLQGALLSSIKIAKTLFDEIHVKLKTRPALIDKMLQAWNVWNHTLAIKEPMQMIMLVTGGKKYNKY